MNNKVIPGCCSRHKVSKKIKMKKGKRVKKAREPKRARERKRVKGERERDKEHIWPLYPWNIKMSIYVNKRGLANAVQSKRGILPATSRK